VTAAGKTYDGQTSGTTSSYTLSAPNVSLSGTLSYTTGSKNAGSYSTANTTGNTLTLSGLYSDQQGYDISYVPTTLSIYKAALTVSNLAASNKVYDSSTTAAVSGTLNGRIGSDAVTLGGGSFSDKNAGNGKTVTANLTGNDAGNYTLQSAATSADITQAALTITATGVNKTYDGTTATSVTFSDNRIAGDILNVSGTAAFNDKNAGNGKAVNISSILLSGDAAANYTYNTAATTSADITQAALNITANNASKAYNGQTYSGGNGVTYAGFINGEDSSVLTGTLAYGGTSQGAATPGNYTITPAGLSANNYTLTFVNGTLTITSPTTPSTPPPRLTNQSRLRCGDCLRPAPGTNHRPFQFFRAIRR